MALAALEQAGRLRAAIPQNFDDFHRQAGSGQVVELHGIFRQATCTACFAVFSTAQLAERWLESGWIPRCQACGWIVKPKVIVFGEEMPHAACQGAWQWVRERDLCRVVGSSLEVKPAASPPFEAVSAGADLIIINRQPTYLDCRAAQVLQEEAAEVLAALVREVLCDRTPL
ncbi:MAG: hypothetical protein MUO23_12095 [Anaerolineales bacterium]|nr:hypothetical protein [Anaerolineales bacterium]